MIFVLWLCSFLICSTNVYANLFDTKSYKTDNGMEVVLLENHRSPIVLVMVWYKVGSADDLPGKSGTAHFLEHLMFKGCPGFSEQELGKHFDSLGAHDNAATSYDYTTYYSYLPSTHIDFAFDIESRRMQQLQLDNKIIEEEKKVVLEERLMGQRSVRSVFFEEFRNTIHNNHPYSNPIIGWTHEIQELSLNDVMTFHKQWYAPDNAILVVAGDITLDQLQKLTQKYFDPIKKRHLKTRYRTQNAPSKNVKKTIEMTANNVEEKTLLLSYSCENFRKKPENFYPLVLLSATLTGFETSLWKNLFVNQKKEASAIQVLYNGIDYDPNNILIGITLNPDTNETTLEKSLQEAIDNLLKKSISQKDFTETKKKLLANALFMKDDVFKSAHYIGRLLANGFALDEINAWEEKIENVTLNDLNRVIVEVFQNAIPTKGILKPKEATS